MPRFDWPSDWPSLLQKPADDSTITLDNANAIASRTINMNIPFNKPYLTGDEIKYISQAITAGQLSGHGDFTRKCHEFFTHKYGFRKTLLTTSCTDALEMAAILVDIQPGDEVIVPSYAFVSTANAFVLRGAKVVFVDSSPDMPNLDVAQLESLITPRTRAIVPIHYAGIACDMDVIMALAEKHGLYVIEDAAQAIDATYKGKPLGAIGHLAAFSFHDTKNIISGEGGMLVVNDQRLEKRAEIVWEKGTNRLAFLRGDVAKYEWNDIGSSYSPPDMVAAFLYAQLQQLDDIQTRRRKLWRRYFEGLQDRHGHGIELPHIADHAGHNGHIFYLVCASPDLRDRLLSHLMEKGIHATFHYLPLHTSPYYKPMHDGRHLLNCERFAACLLRLPLFYALTDDEQEGIIDAVREFL